MPPTPSISPAWTDLGHGWARDERGNSVRTITEIEDVVAEHCEGSHGAFTHLTKGALLHEGGKFVANRDGHLPDLSIVRLSGHAAAYRLRLAQAAGLRKAVAA